MTVPLLGRTGARDRRRAIVPPPIAPISLGDVAALSGRRSRAEGKTVITM
jgi:hypothetical protein